MKSLPSGEYRNLRLLAEAIHTNECVAFVGAGFSVPAGMPAWKPLLRDLHKYLKAHLLDAHPQQRELLAYADRCIKDNELARAASALRTLDPDRRVLERLRHLFNRQVLQHQPDEAQAEMQSRLDCLLSLPWAGVVTTNYDTLLADRRHWQHEVSSPWQLSNLGRALKATRRPFLVHLHGNVDGSMVLSEEDYDKVYFGSQAVDSFLHALLLRYTVVFIGTLVEDRFVEYKRRLQAIFEDTWEPLSWGPPLTREFVVLPSTAATRGTYLESTKGFSVAFYPDSGRHEGFVPFLRKLNDNVKAIAGGRRLDRFNKKILSIVQREPGGVEFLDVVRRFERWFQPGDDSAVGAPTARELFYRLHYLVHKHHLAHSASTRRFTAPASPKTRRRK